MGRPDYGGNIKYCQPPGSNDAVAEKFIIGHGSYTSFHTARTVIDGPILRLEPAPVPYVTTKRLQWDSVVNNERQSELNLITCRQGLRKRWPLLRSVSNVRAFDRLLKPVVANTDLPVVRVTDEWLGWTITERPFGKQAGASP